MHRILQALGVAGLASVLAMSAPLAEAKDVTLGYSSVGLSYPFAAAIAKGFQDAATAAGVKAVVLDAKGNVEKQANDIDDLIAQKVDGIAIMPLDSTVAQGWVDRAASHDIPTVAVASEIGDPHKRPIKQVYEKLSALVTQDEVTAGEQAGAMAAKMLPPGKTAKIAIIEGSAGYAEVTQRTQGFKAGLDKAGVKYQIVASQPGDWTSEKAESTCQNILASNPDIDLFFNQSDDMVVGCGLAVRAAGSNAKLIGMGGSRLAINAIKTGDVAGTVCYKPEEIGHLAFKALYGAVTKKNTTKAAFVAYDTPPVTKANLQSCVPQW
ncbi:sugar ABC transporter substrate-binding protein [Paraburkholderia sp. DHOC27]|uniref:sugar ABC transporter substrate-binding protein n=1 Tax=Paraburkholderia sp. DHOC27 TaxID=2303330 RepID=UPI000E3EDF21|nr:sugar ABC transporter substrate-binding protein [Paraburkholderia sp. DHOC27]RFU48437.1 sugar ABC transporter substrate-binding protein [Paraburkholderia sp. DHOC27]